MLSSSPTPNGDTPNSVAPAPTPSSGNEEFRRFAAAAGAEVKRSFNLIIEVLKNPMRSAEQSFGLSWAELMLTYLFVLGASSLITSLISGQWYLAVALLVPQILGSFVVSGIVVALIWFALDQLKSRRDVRELAESWLVCSIPGIALSVAATILVMVAFRPWIHASLSLSILSLFVTVGLFYISLVHRFKIDRTLSGWISAGILLVSLLGSVPLFYPSSPASLYWDTGTLSDIEKQRLTEQYIELMNK